MDTRLVELKDAIYNAVYDRALAEAREDVLTDVVAGLASIDWSGLDFEHRDAIAIDGLIANLASRLGGRDKVAYFVTYAFWRLVAARDISVRLDVGQRDEDDEPLPHRHFVPLEGNAIQGTSTILTAEGEQRPYMWLYVEAKEPPAQDATAREAWRGL